MKGINLGNIKLRIGIKMGLEKVFLAFLKFYGWVFDVIKGYIDDIWSFEIELRNARDLLFSFSPINL